MKKLFSILMILLLCEPSFAAILFDGVNEYVDIGNVSTLNFERTDSFSASAWVYTTDTTPAVQSIITKEKLVANYHGWGFYLFRRASVDSTSLSFILISDGGAGVPPYPSGIEVNAGASAIAANTLYHVAFTYDGGSAASGVKLYINGNLQTNTVVSDTLGTGSTQTSVKAAIGGRDPDNLGQTMKGTIDDVRVYNRVLTDGEVLSLYESKLRGTFIGGGLIGYWTLNEGEGGTTASGATAIDTAGGNHGTVTNTPVWNSGGVQLSYPPSIQ